MQQIPLEITYEVHPNTNPAPNPRTLTLTLILTLTLTHETYPNRIPNPDPHPHQDIKYSFKVSPRSRDTMLLTIGEQVTLNPTLTRP
eukprot:scaffold63143_cov24-Phaeocystis_antarctica.AAC.1